MKKEGYYSTGEFMKQANITKKTIRYYDEKDILKPSFVSDSGARYYTEKDLAKLQQILLLKYLGFSLSDIREMQVDDADKHFIVNSLNIQQKLVEDRIEQLQLVSNTIREATEDLQADAVARDQHFKHGGDCHARSLKPVAGDRAPCHQPSYVVCRYSALGRTQLS